MRSMLDAHPDVHCGEGKIRLEIEILFLSLETHIIPQILDRRDSFVDEYRQAKLNHMEVGEAVQSAAVSRVENFAILKIQISSKN